LRFTFTSVFSLREDSTAISKPSLARESYTLLPSKAKWKTENTVRRALLLFSHPPLQSPAISGSTPPPKAPPSPSHPIHHLLHFQQFFHHHSRRITWIYAWSSLLFIAGYVPRAHGAWHSSDAAISISSVVLLYAVPPVYERGNYLVRSRCLH